MTQKEEIRIGVLISGNGSNLQAIIDKCESGELPAKVACVISNKESVFGLQRARNYDIPAITLDHRTSASRIIYDSKIVSILKGYNVDLVILAGFMRIITSVLIEAFPNAIMNLHPAILPLFPGTTAAQDAIDYGVKVSGCSVHFVDAGTDTGPIIIQATVPVYDTDTAETLMERIHPEEHRIYPEAIKLFCEGRLQVKGRKVIISPKKESVPD